MPNSCQTKRSWKKAASKKTPPYTNYGKALFYFDGQTIRNKDRYGEALYFVDGQNLKYKDRYGKTAYYFEGIPEKWVIVCLIR